MIKNCKSYDEAIRTALAWLAARRAKLEEAYEARSGGFGMRTIGGAAGYRLEFHPPSGAHLNVWCRAEKGPHYAFPGSSGTVKALWRQLYYWDPALKRRTRE
jgi:hypothetical protein